MRQKYVQAGERALARMAARARTDNKADLETRNVEEVAVDLSDELFDPARPVTLFLNGRKAFEGKVEWDVARSLEEVRRRGDSSRFFFGRVVMKP